MFTASGLIVRFLKVFEKSNYQSIKWVRYLTKASGNYQIRVRACCFFYCESGVDGATVLRTTTQRRPFIPGYHIVVFNADQRRLFIRWLSELVQTAFLPASV